MQILYTADTHVYPPYFDRLLRAAEITLPGAVIVGGDIIPDWQGGIQASIEPHKAWVRDKLIPRLLDFRAACANVPVLLDLGNDDIAAARHLLEERDGTDLHLLHMRLVKLSAKLAVAGCMKVNPTPFRIKDGEKPDCRDHSGLSDPAVAPEGTITTSGFAAPYRLDPAGGTIEDDLDELSGMLDGAAWRDCSVIFVSHAPPNGTDLDRTASGHHVGSLAVRRFIERWGPTGRLLAACHGHIHESPWQTGRAWQYVGGIPCFNIGQRPKLLRALLMDTDNIVDTARLVLIGPRDEIRVMEKDEWLPEG